MDLKMNEKEDWFEGCESPLKIKDESELYNSFTDIQMETAEVKQEIDISQEPAPECSIAWCSIKVEEEDDDDDDYADDDADDHGNQRLDPICQVFIKEDPVEGDAEGGPVKSGTEVDGKHSSKLSAKTPFFSCKFCGTNWVTLSLLKSHIIRKHTEKKPFRCDICDYKSTWSTNLKTHLRTHTKDELLAFYLLGDRSTLGKLLKIKK
ncbi:protein glass isoform X2 [Nilaparvata lugens]|uniref:protein glass isoform X2 n=1 Tax=Nilaparvata lugens TaxID=108931 RepID=UPI00193CE663|nr:protein glass isoform X2 [Nilaparvata lugens]